MFGNRLDNRRSNLRECTYSHNLYNSSSRKANRYGQPATSRYKGVHRNKRAKTEKWVAQIQVNGKTTHLGTFNNEEDAAQAYDTAAKELFGEFARLNFPDQ